jgi:hypothetical protein
MAMVEPLESRWLMAVTGVEWDEQFGGDGRVELVHSRDFVRAPLVLGDGRIIAASTAG